MSPFTNYAWIIGIQFYVYVYVFIIDDRVSCGFLPALPP